MKMNRDELIKKWSTLLNSTNNDCLCMLIEPMETKIMEPQMTKPEYIFHKVVCDETNNTQEDIENQVVNVDIYGEIISRIEEINIDITLNKND